jgi:hypothetical protein
VTIKSAFFVVTVGAAALFGCSALDPYPTAPAPSTSSGPPGPHIGMCYNTLHTTLAAVQVEAQNECTADYPGSTAVLADTDWYLQNCPLLLPIRANFICAAKR